MRLYKSVCEMAKEACNLQQDLRLRPMELCQGKNQVGKKWYKTCLKSIFYEICGTFIVIASQAKD